MQIEYGKAPINYIDGVPAHKAGEWEGIKSCKFHSYKRVIRPQSHGIIFNDNETILPKRKLLGPTGPSPEYVFRPHSKRVENNYQHIKRPEGLKHIPFPTKESVPRPEKKHYFPYRIQKEKEENELNKKMNNEYFVHNEFKVIGEKGFGDRPYDNITNRRLLGMNFVRDQFGKIRFDDENDPYKTKKQIKIDKINEKKSIKDNLNKDINYVHNLNNWDKVNFPKNKSQPVLQSATNPINSQPEQ